MKLYEYEGKELFKKYNIPVPVGELLSTNPLTLNYPMIAKAQVLTGGRGKAGGIKEVKNEREFKRITQELIGMKIKEETVTHIYLEEKISYQEEFYLSIIIDRNKKCPVLIVSRQGGVDIENVPDEEILFININPLIGLQTYMIRKASLFLNVNYDLLSDLLLKLWDLYKKEQAELVEINPLFFEGKNQFIAGDAKVILETKHNELPLKLGRNSKTFESRCEELGASGVELNGEVAVITSGAGLGMATFDIVSSKKGTVRAVVDLGGHVIHDILKAQSLIKEIKKLKPKIYLFNFYFQLASCKILSLAIAKELGNSSIPVIVRLKGQDEDHSKKILSPFNNIVLADNLEHACDLVQKPLFQGEK
ncbi:ATP-grasp domain-containing protein [Alkalihalobacillus sp. TS-13]|uniref:ATP-grasp domain-containing protein n=1 Tax=Alkalihalobacillus sp. TS-13 TaxID=2842455 RepID=UPI001C878BB7|nr:ATP-grasp domain-containing protein [Alkalihalobacillus sp. TS-13]